MNTIKNHRLAWAWLLAAACTPIATAAPDTATGPPSTGLTRQQVIAEMRAHHRTHRWDESQGGWVPRVDAPRTAGGATRAEVAASTLLFLETHDWDEATQLWTEHPRIPRTR